MFYKLVALTYEVKKPKLKFCIYELLYSLHKLKDRKSMLPYPFEDSLIETKFGEFYVKKGSTEAITVSPAYERPDLNYLIKIISKNISSKNILFLDIGANIGGYTVAVGNTFRDKDAVKIISYEPIGEYYEVLKRNVSVNGLDGKVECKKIALSDVCEHRWVEFQGIREEVRTSTLDKELKDLINDADLIIIKIDVEGMEKSVLQGGREVLSSGKPFYLLVEDFVNTNIVTFVRDELNADFVDKFTPYNSWWRITKTLVL